MSNVASAFPNIRDGNVKIVLSERPEDVLMLNTSVLTRDSPFFKASLERLEWSHNKIVKVEGEKRVEYENKLLELDFDGGDTLPLLLGANVETAAERLKQKREKHDVNRRNNNNETIFTGSMYRSGTVITAYKMGFALMCSLRIDLPATEVHKASFFIPALVDFLDVYGLLPTYNDKVIGVIFSGSCDGYELVAGDPLRFLRVACTLQSKVIYQEAMIHAVGIVDKLGDLRTCDSEWFSKIGEHQLHQQFTSHVQTFHDKIARNERHFIHVQPDCCNKLGSARDIGVAIFRTWVAKNSSEYHPSHAAIIKILERDYDVANEIRAWGPQHNHQIMDVQFGHIERAVENSFIQLRNYIVREFGDGRLPTASPRQSIGCLRMAHHGNPYHYYANVEFPKDYKYPWETENKATLPTFRPFESAAAKEFDRGSIAFS